MCWIFLEACQHGLSVFLSINHLNGQESFSLATIPAQTWQASQNAAALPEEDKDREDIDNLVFIPNRSIGQTQPSQPL